MITPPSLFCLNCGAANPPQAKFCSACGNPLSAWREENIPTSLVSVEQRLQDTVPANPPTIPVLPTQPPDSNPSNEPPGNKRSPYRRAVLVAVVILLIGSSVLALTLINNANATNQKNVLATQQAQATSGARLATAAEATHEIATSIAVAQATNNAAAATNVAQTQATNSAATATSAANPDPYQPTNSTLAFIDPLSQPDVWANGSNTSFGGQCQFVNRTYQVSQLKVPALFECVSYTATYANFVFEVRMTVLKGDCGGMTLRGSSNNSDTYYFRICPIGTYAFMRYSSNGNPTILTTGGVSSVFNPGLNQSNVIAAVANNSTFTLFINHQRVAVVNDTSYTQGILGLVADAYSDQTVVAFQDARVWTIP